jgi:hypothetical protein
VSVAILNAAPNPREKPMTDTINAETVAIEQGPLLPESLRFESDPWTFFYRAGEMIRELRKALKNKARMGAKATGLLRTE